MFNLLSLTIDLRNLAIVFVLVFILVLIIVAYVKNYKWSIKRVDRMKGAEFESFMKEVFEILGYTVEKTKTSGDQGIDLIIKKHFRSQLCLNTIFL